MKILFFDTESTDLKGMMARMLCASFCDLTGKPYTLRLDDPALRGRSKIDDGKLCVAIRDELEKANLIVSWNGKLHDIPLLNAKLAKAGHRRYVPKNWHLDLMYYAGGVSMKIGSRKLDNVAKFFKLPEQKSPLDWDTWQAAGVGEKEAVDYVVHHCEADVKVLRAAYDHLLPYVASLTR